MHLAAIYSERGGCSDHCRGNVVQEAGNREHAEQQNERSKPAAGQDAGQCRRNAALFEMTGEYLEANQETEQVYQDHPFMAKVRRQPCKAGPVFKAGEDELEAGNRDESRNGDSQSVLVI